MKEDNSVPKKRSSSKKKSSKKKRNDDDMVNEKERLKKELQIANTPKSPSSTKKKKKKKKSAGTGADSSVSTPTSVAAATTSSSSHLRSIDFDDDPRPSRPSGVAVVSSPTPTERAKLGRQQHPVQEGQLLQEDDSTAVPIISGDFVVPVSYYEEGDDEVDIEDNIGSGGMIMPPEVTQKIATMATATRSTTPKAVAASKPPPAAYFSKPPPEAQQQQRKRRILWIGLICLILIAVIVLAVAIGLSKGDDDNKVSAVGTANEEAISSPSDGTTTGGTANTTVTQAPSTPAPSTQAPSPATPTLPPTPLPTTAAPTTMTPTVTQPTSPPTFDVEVCYLADLEDSCDNDGRFTEYGTVQVSCPETFLDAWWNEVWFDADCEFKLCCGNTVPQNNDDNNLIAFCADEDDSNDNTVVIGHLLSSNEDPYDNGGSWFGLGIFALRDWDVRYAYTCHPNSQSACFMAEECPDNYNDYGYAGILADERDQCPFSSGLNPEPATFEWGWWWCYPKICCPF